MSNTFNSVITQFECLATAIYVHHTQQFANICVLHQCKLMAFQIEFALGVNMILAEMVPISTEGGSMMLLAGG